MLYRDYIGMLFPKHETLNPYFLLRTSKLGLRASFRRDPLLQTPVAYGSNMGTTWLHTGLRMGVYERYMSHSLN